MQLLIDLSTVNHTAFFREPAHFTFLVEKPRVRSSRIRRPMPDPDLVGRLLHRAGAVQRRDGRSSEAIPNLSAQKLEIWATDLSLEVVKRRRQGDLQHEGGRRASSPVRLRRFFLRGKGPEATARSGSSPSCAIW